MQAATRFSDQQRKTLGLLSLANETDLARSIEVSGEPSNPHKVLATKLFRCDYAQVTPDMAQQAKRYGLSARYR